MTNVKLVIVCQIGLTVKPVQTPAKECGHKTCYPMACERLRRLGIVVNCEDMKK